MVLKIAVCALLLSLSQVYASDCSTDVMARIENLAEMNDNALCSSDNFYELLDIAKQLINCERPCLYAVGFSRLSKLAEEVAKKLVAFEKCLDSIQDFELKATRKKIMQVFKKYLDPHSDKVIEAVEGVVRGIKMGTNPLFERLYAGTSWINRLINNKPSTV